LTAETTISTSRRRRCQTRHFGGALGSGGRDRDLVVAWSSRSRWPAFPWTVSGVIAWIAAGLLAFSIGRRPLWTVIVRLAASPPVLIVYDYARGLAEGLGLPVLWQQPVDVDRFLTGGTVPTVWLQEHLKLGHSTWWEAVVSLTYVSFFLLPYVVAGVLWLRSRSAFHQWAAAVRHDVVPGRGVLRRAAAPPTGVGGGSVSSPTCTIRRPTRAACTQRPVRQIGRLLGALPSRPRWGRAVGRAAGTAGDGAPCTSRSPGSCSTRAAVRPRRGDAVAARRLHAAVRAVRLAPGSRAVATLLVAYPVLMAFSLIYSAEHYLIDVLAGWAMAVAFSSATTAGAAPKSAPRSRYAGGQTPTAMEHQVAPDRNDAVATSPSGEALSTRRARSTAEPDQPAITVTRRRVKENVRRQWMATMARVATTSSGLGFGSDLATKVWEASGHLETFTDR